MAPPPQPPLLSSLSSSLHVNKSASNGRLVKLNNGKEIKLPEWMSIQHLPEHAIVATASSSNDSLPAGQQTDNNNPQLEPNDYQETIETSLTSASTSTSNVGRTSRSRSSRLKNNAAKEKHATNSTIIKHSHINNSGNNLHAVTASHFRLSKQRAMHTEDPPTPTEISSHIRYLSQECFQLIAGHVDECAALALTFSNNEAASPAIANNAVHATTEEVSTVIPSEASSSISRGKVAPKYSLTTLVHEIQTYFDMFRPEEETEEEKEESQEQELESEVLMSDNNTNLLNGLVESSSQSQQYISNSTPTETDTSSPNSSMELILQQRQQILQQMIPSFHKQPLSPIVTLKYNPSLLPMIIIKCYPNLLDRMQIVRGLVSDLAVGKRHTTTVKERQTKEQEKDEVEVETSPCVCVIRKSADLVEQGQLIAEVLSQCITNDPNGENFAMQLQKRRKRQKIQHSFGDTGNHGVLFKSIWSWERSLVEWASVTDAFDSIVVILEDPENIPSPTLDSFFTSLASLRCNHHVPIHVVLLNAVPGGLGDRLSKLRQPSFHNVGGGFADGGVAIKELYLPLPQIQFDLFIEKVFSGECVPTFLWNYLDLFSRLREVFLEYDNSIVSTAKQLKHELRLIFALPDTFLSMMGCEQFVLPNWPRIVWLLGDKHARAIISSNWPFHMPPSKGNGKDIYPFDSLQRIHSSLFHNNFHKKIDTIFDITSSKMMLQPSLSNNSKFTSGSSTKQLLLLLCNMRCEVIHELTSHVDLSLALCNKLNEYIILVGNIAASKDPNPDMTIALVENMLCWTEETLPWQGFSEYASMSPIVQPRRDVAIDLFLPPPQNLAHCYLAQARRLVFQVFQCRVMTLSEWYEKYFDIVTGDDERAKGMSSNESAFFLAVGELVHCGFVRKLTTSRRNENTYEKMALVWGSGK